MIIHTIGGGDFLFKTFNAIATICTSSSFAESAAIAASLGLLWVILAKMVSSDWVSSAKWFVIAVVSYNAFIIPKTTVEIYDKTEPAVARVIDNVPYPLAAFASLTSRVGYNITDMFESIFALPDDMKYQSQGFLMGGEIMDQLGKINVKDQRLRNNLSVFVDECVIWRIITGPFTAEGVFNSPDLFAYLDANPLSNLIWVKYYDEFGVETLPSCKEAWGR